jgi:hypothetical protein
MNNTLLLATVTTPSPATSVIRLPDLIDRPPPWI